MTTVRFIVVMAMLRAPMLLLRLTTVHGEAQVSKVPVLADDDKMMAPLFAPCLARSTAALRCAMPQRRCVGAPRFVHFYGFRGLGFRVEGFRV